MDWQEWFGGSRQHGAAELVQVRFRNGGVSTIRPAGDFTWRWERVQRFCDIVAWRYPE